MVNNGDFIKRLEEIIKYHDISASSFADNIGVQRSSISHLLAGRNKPSLEFVMKVVKAYPEVNLYWLLNGKGDFPKKKENGPTSFDTATDINDAVKNETTAPPKPKASRSIEKIVIFYTDGSFRSYEN